MDETLRLYKKLSNGGKLEMSATCCSEDVWIDKEELEAALKAMLKCVLEQYDIHREHEVAVEQ